MNAITYIQQHGVEKAREVVEGAPDNTATHYVISKRPYYYSIDFQSYFDNGDWQDSDYTSEQDLANDYEPQNVIRISDLKRLVDSVDIIAKVGGIHEAIEEHTKWMHAPELHLYRIGESVERLKQAIADYESIGGEHV